MCGRVWLRVTKPVRKPMGFGVEKPHTWKVGSSYRTVLNNRIYFILHFILTMPCVFHMQFQSAYHVVVKFSLLFFLLTLYCFLKDTSCISHGFSLYSYRYSPVSLCFTNWLPSFLLTQFALVATWAKLKIR